MQTIQCFAITYLWVLSPTFLAAVNVACLRARHCRRRREHAEGLCFGRRLRQMGGVGWERDLERLRSFWEIKCINVELSRAI